LVDGPANLKAAAMKPMMVDDPTLFQIPLPMLSSKIAQAASQTVIPPTPRLPKRSLPKTSATPQTEPRTRIIRMFFVVITAASRSSSPRTGGPKTVRRKMVEPSSFNISFKQASRRSAEKRQSGARIDCSVVLALARRRIFA
jgi:hypothetical protein